MGQCECRPLATKGRSDDVFQANIVASEIRDPGRALPKAIKAAMIVVLSSFELVNIAYYILVPWDKLSSNNAVAVAAATSLLGRPAGILVTALVAISCAGSITSNVFSVGRLTIAASQRHVRAPVETTCETYINFVHQQSVPTCNIQQKRIVEDSEGRCRQRFFVHPRRPNVSPLESWCMPRHANTKYSYANGLALFVTLAYILTGSFRALLTFVGMAEWVFYVSTVAGLLILRRREPEMDRPYRPLVILPIIFVIVGTLVILRSALFAPVQSGVLLGLLIAGALISKLRSRQSS
jgi:amino acid transporter